ncbi:hypothetical protein LEP1GSC050_2787 [Leptospira broomii serovar Hurstbridge str. 5399]|uniref:Uncharacterized protein n=2 Tax=Leptospira broomii TaxID=301541 RepID=T0GF24_9LEPT|nr:hypothetical protein LEP1GSC050_2787 [Leptospira broomii serovar Hurstbridge str. 5399]
MSIIAKEARLGINTKDGLLVNFTSDWNLDFSIRSAMVNDCGIMIADPNREYRFTGYFETVYNGNIRTTFFPRVFTKRKFLLRSDEFSYFGTLKRDRYGNFTQINIEKDKEYCMQELKRIFGDQFNENKVKPRLLVKYDD